MENNQPQVLYFITGSTSNTAIQLQDIYENKEKFLNEDEFNLNLNLVVGLNYSLFQIGLCKHEKFKIIGFDIHISFITENYIPPEDCLKISSKSYQSIFASYYSTGINIVNDNN